jgi:nitronate monooxygenase
MIKVQLGGSLTHDDTTSEDHHQAELLARLNELLEAERAGVRVTADTLVQVHDQDARDLIEAVHRDEIQWSTMLLHAIREIDGKSSHRTGDFLQKAMAIPDVNERLAFLNRGQGWVAKKLRELLPMVSDPTLHQNLTNMLNAHVINLDKVNHYLALHGTAKHNPS